MEYNTTSDTNVVLRAAIEAEKDRIAVEPYVTQSMHQGLIGHARGFWAGTLMGLGSGALTGGIVSMAFGAALGFPPLAIIGGLAAIGAGTGGIIGSRIGSSAGAIGGAMAERERRDRGRELEAEILRSPEKQAEVVAKFKANPVVEKSTTVSEAFATMPTHKAVGKLVNWKTLLLTSALCAVAGAAMFAGGFALTGTVAVAGVEIAKTMAMAVGFGAAVGAGVGATFGIAYPMVFASLTRGFGDVFSGHAVEGKSMHKAPNHQIMQAQEALLSEATHPKRREMEQPSKQVSQAAREGQLAAALDAHIRLA